MDNNLNNWNSFWENQFELICERGDAFFTKGYTLLASSEVLFRKSEQILKKITGGEKGRVIIIPRYWKETQTSALLSGYLPAYLLLALAFENFIKEYLCRLDGSLRVRTKQFPEFLRSHDLLKLILKGDIILEKDEELLIQFLKSHLLWRGRYNIPLKSHEYAAFYTTDFKKIYVHTSFEKSGKFSPEVKSILRKLGVRYRGI